MRTDRAEVARILKVSYKTLLNKISECELTPPSRRQFWPRGGGVARLLIIVSTTEPA